MALSRDGDTCVGSARSACGVDLYLALSSCGDLFSRFGGHKQAAGLTMAAEHIDSFRKRLSDAVAMQLQGRPLMPETAYDAVLPLTGITLELIEQIGRLEPFGTGNPAPVFLLKDVDVVSARAVGAEGAHLKLTLSQDGSILDAIAFRMGSRAGPLRGLCDLAVTPTANVFGGRTSAECRVEAVGSAEARFITDEKAEARAILQEFDSFCRINKFSGAYETADQPPAPESAQGTLYLCRTAETAARIAALFPGLDIPDGTRRDPRAYNGLWLCGELRCLGPYDRIVLCDGLLDVREAERLRALYPQARIIALPRSAPLLRRLETLRFSVDDMRALYVALRGGKRPDRSQPQTEAMLRVLQSMELIGPMNELLPMRRSDPQCDPLYRLIQGCET